MAPETNIASSSSPFNERHSLGFTIVGEGDGVMILPADAGMISVMKQSSRSLSCDLGGYDGPGCAWTCRLCCYENADGSSNICSVCGSKRAVAAGGTTHPLPPPTIEHENDPPPEDIKNTTTASLYSIKEPGIKENEDTEIHLTALHSFNEPDSNESEDTEKKGDASLFSTDDVKRTANQDEENKSEAGEGPSNSFQEPLPITENQENPPVKEEGSEAQKRVSFCSQGSTKTTASFQELMSMSFANWSLSDNGPWQCASCTYLNQETLHLTCAACGESRSKLKPSTSKNALNDYFNSSWGSAEAMRLAGTDIIFNEFGNKLSERERMNEVIADQFRMLSGLQSVNEEACKGDDNGSRASGDGGGNLKGTRRQLDETKRTIARLESQLALERREQELAEEAQRHRQVELDSHGSDENVDSMAAMELMVQQRLLNDWKNSWEAREQQLEYVRMQQKSILQRYQGSL